MASTKIATESIGFSADHIDGLGYVETVSSVLKKFLGESGASALLSYTGVPDPSTFETELRPILGEGAQIILQQVKVRQRLNSIELRR